MVKLGFFVAILTLPAIASVDKAIPSSAASTVAPNSRSNVSGAAKWIVVSRTHHIYDDAPEHLKSLLRGKVPEFNIFANPPVYPPGMSAADFEGLQEEFGSTDLS
jgi:hypothetical protein